MGKDTIHRNFTAPLIKRFVRKGFPVLMCLGLASCSSDDAGKSPLADEESDILVMVGDSALTMREVLVRIPSGLPASDSIMLFQSIVDGWLERNLLTSLAESKLDNLPEIDRLVEDYRRKLIIASYRRKLRETYQDGVGREEVENYYRLNSADMILERPVIKGLYVKIPSDAKRLADIRRWMRTATPEAIDNLERYGLEEAMEYSFFNNEWTDWDIIGRQIPYRFDNADTFVAQNTDFETSRRGITYLLHISGHLPSGEKMPFEVAEGIISERLAESRGEKYEEKLMADLYRSARASGRLRCVNYDPFEHRIIAERDSGDLRENEKTNR